MAIVEATGDWGSGSEWGSWGGSEGCYDSDLLDTEDRDVVQHPTLVVAHDCQSCTVTGFTSAQLEALSSFRIDDSAFQVYVDRVSTIIFISHNLGVMHVRLDQSNDTICRGTSQFFEKIVDAIRSRADSKSCD